MFSERQKTVFTRVLEELLRRGGGWPCGRLVVSQLQKNGQRAPDFLIASVHRAHFGWSFERSHLETTKGTTKQTFLSSYLQIARGHWRNGDMLHPGWDSHRLRHHSYRLILPTEDGSNQQNASQSAREDCRGRHLCGSDFTQH